MRNPAHSLGLYFIVASTALSGCQASSPEQVGETRVKSIGQKYLDVNAPQWKSEYSLPSIVIDRGNYWEYTFQMPAGSVGGTPAVYIDKDSLKVTKLFHEQ